ncbi:MAG: MoxR family ATPase [Candidatus Thiothrix sulfatifontis]|nr:MAG: MoxR family ATPase [Candidatus Thiothrix sulfatifontis]
MTYPFNLLAQSDSQAVLDALQNRRIPKDGLKTDAPRFVPDIDLQEAINTALAVGEPLLLTGEPGTGKTQAAYYVAWKLGLGDVLHFQVKSDSTAQDLLYHFDSVRYFHDAHLLAGATLSKTNYVEERPLWTALTSDKPRVLLIDEIDKAPRDFPNDLLHELDQMSFTVKETGEVVTVQDHNRPLVFITSNSERRLPEAFLRRCVFHHIDFRREMLQAVLASHHASFSRFSDGFLELAVNRFMLLRKERLRKIPATGELLVWLKTMALDAGTSSQRLDELFRQLENSQKKPPYLGTLLKDREDVKAMQQRYPA